VDIPFFDEESAKTFFSGKMPENTKFDLGIIRSDEKCSFSLGTSALRKRPAHSPKTGRF
jgi:hypothetical protein